MSRMDFDYNVRVLDAEITIIKSAKSSHGFCNLLRGVMWTHDIEHKDERDSVVYNMCYFYGPYEEYVGGVYLGKNYLNADRKFMAFNKTDALLLLLKKKRDLERKKKR